MVSKWGAATDADAAQTDARWYDSRLPSWRKRIGELGINPQVEPCCLLKFVLARFSPPSKDERFCETKTRLAARLATRQRLGNLGRPIFICRPHRVRIHVSDLLERASDGWVRFDACWPQLLSPRALIPPIRCPVLDGDACFWPTQEAPLWHE